MIDTTTHRNAAVKREPDAVPEHSVVVKREDGNGDSSSLCPNTFKLDENILRCYLLPRHPGPHYDQTVFLCWATERENNVALVRLVQSVMQAVADASN